MGAYIDLANQTKEAWLRKNAIPVTSTPKTIDDVPGFLLVCLVDNGPFTAAGIAFDERELQAFLSPDGRYKEWWWAPKDKLMDPEVSSLHYYL